MQEGILAAKDAVPAEGEPNFRRIAAQRLAEETGRRNADDGEGMAVEDDGRTDDGWVGAVLLLPGAIAQHGDRRRRELIVTRDDGATGERADAEGGEVIAADKFAAQGLGDAVALAAADSVRLRCPA